MTTTGACGFIGAAPVVKVRTIEETKRDQEAAKSRARVSHALGNVDLPDASAPQTDERAKYERMWSHEEYRMVAPGESAAAKFVQEVQPRAGSTIIDFGTGTGRGALMLAIMGKLKVEMLDFADNCLDPEVRQALDTQGDALKFRLHDLNKPMPVRAPYGFCVDVMEHIPEAEVDAVLENILKAAQHVYFQISCTDDSCGKLIDAPLHLSVHPHAWWLKKLQDAGCTIHWSKDEGHQCVFYVTAWATAKDIVDIGVLNVTEEKLSENVRANMAGGWQELVPHPVNDMEVIILAGGPSLAQFEDDIKERREAGAKLVTVNGTYLWAMEKGLKVSAQVVVDGRAFNARFTRPVVEDCKYLISSQVDPSTLEGLPKDRTMLWHTNMQCVAKTLEELKRPAYMVPCGSTVVLRTLMLMRMLGFRNFHLYGFDSCLVGDKHHAYSQPENDGVTEIKVELAGREFVCHPWMISQAQEFRALVEAFGDEFDLEVYGDGLIAHIIKNAAQIADNALLV